MRKSLLPVIFTIILFGFTTHAAKADTKNSSLQSGSSNSYIVTPTDSPKETYVEENVQASENILNETTVDTAPQSIIADACDCAIHQQNASKNSSPLSTPSQPDSQSKIAGFEPIGGFGFHHPILLNPSLIALASHLYLSFVLLFFGFSFNRLYLRFRTSLSPPAVG